MGLKTKIVVSVNAIFGIMAYVNNGAIFQIWWVSNLMLVLAWYFLFTGTTNKTSSKSESTEKRRRANLNVDKAYSEVEYWRGETLRLDPETNAAAYYRAQEKLDAATKRLSYAKSGTK